MVDFAEVTGHVAAGCCTLTVLGMNVTVVHPRRIAWSEFACAHSSPPGSWRDASSCSVRVRV
jgi:hypothetical protein